MHACNRQKGEHHHYDTVTRAMGEARERGVLDRGTRALGRGVGDRLFRPLVPRAHGLPAPRQVKRKENVLSQHLPSLQFVEYFLSTVICADRLLLGRSL